MSVYIALRDDYDSIQLRCLAKRSLDPRQVRRLLSLAAVYDGMSRTEVRSNDEAVLAERLTHHVHILEMNGDSFRLNQSKKRRKSPKNI